MKLTITTLNELVYRFADKTIADDEFGVYRGRIENNIALSRSVSDSGSSLTSITIHLINHDKIIPDSVKLWNAKAEILTDNGHSWTGKVTSYRTDAGGKLILVATEQTAPELSRDLPDEFVRLVEIDENVHVSALNLTVPLVVGGTASDPIQVKGILKNKTNAIYYLCVGEIREIVSVRVGTEKLTRTEAEARGYLCYTGSQSQAAEPGIAYIQISDPELRKNSDGSYVEIGAEVVGLKLGDHSVEECRNGARFLYWLLKTPSTGPCGWGLGIADADIDADAFTTAISAVHAAELKLDGIIYEQKTARNWITEICRAIRGSYEIGTDGKRRLFVQAPGSSEFTFTDSNMELISSGMGAFTGRVYNKGRLNYSYNPFTGYFMQSANFSDSASIAEIEEQEFIGDSFLIRDAATAQKILNYTCKNSLIAAYSISFSTMTLPIRCRVGTIITVNHARQGVKGLFRIVGLQAGDHINRIEAVRYDVSVFDNGSVAVPVDWPEDLPITPLVTPAAPSGLSLTQVAIEAADGTTVFGIKGTFSFPADQHLGASVEWGEGLLPVYNWNSLGLLQGNNFEILGLKNDTAYAVRVRMISATGRSEYVTATITTESDTLPPPVPFLSITSFFKNISISLSLSSYPADMLGYIIYRNTVNNSSTATVVASVDAHNAAKFVDILDKYETYYYWAKSVDVWGNRSNFSAVASATTEQIVSEDLAATAMQMPTGALLSLSAKNCTTASIAEVNGVKDVSGNGNHGQAFGGVEVVDSEMGKAFSFDGINDYITDNSVTYENATEFTVSVWAKKTGYTQYQSIYSDYYSGLKRSVMLGYENPEGRMYFYCSDGTIINSVGASNVFIQDEWAHWTGVFKGSEYMRLYKNGVLVSGRTTDVPEKIAVSHYDRYFGRSANRYFNGLIAHPKIFNRALSPSEVKTLYMFPDDVAFGQLTADLIGANVIKAQNLITSEAIITNKAQINSGVFNEILVLDSDFTDTTNTATTAQSTANTALNNANTALNNANTANAAISNMTNDNKLTPDEKQLTKKEWDIIVSEKPKNDTQADSFGVSKTAYGTAYSALSTYITPLLSSLTTTSDIVGTTFRTKFKDYYDARTDLLNAIATKSKQVADSAQSTANTAKTAVDNWAVAGTNYTQIKGGVITTGQIKSGDYMPPVLPSDGFAVSGSSYDLDNATITTENFYSNTTGAGIKGHIEADTGKIGNWVIEHSGSLVNAGAITQDQIKNVYVTTLGTESYNFGLSLTRSYIVAGSVWTDYQARYSSDHVYLYSNGYQATLDSMALTINDPSNTNAATLSRKSLTIRGNTSSTVTIDSDNPKIVFESADLTQKAALVFTDADSYAAPASVSLVGNQGNEVFIAPKFVSDNQNGLRMKYGMSPAAIFHQNSDWFYLMFTNANDSNGGGNSLRPFYVNKTNGSVTFGNGVDLGSGGLRLNGFATSQSRTDQGYLKFNGIIIQWGRAYFANAGWYNVTFPTAFSSESGWGLGIVSSDDSHTRCSDFASTGCNMYTAAGNYVNWVAIGY